VLDIALKLRRAYWNSPSPVKLGETSESRLNTSDWSRTGMLAKVEGEPRPAGAVEMLWNLWS
jgi:hypothetical protein